MAPTGKFLLDSNGQPIGVRGVSDFDATEQGFFSWSCDPALVTSTLIMPTAGLVQTSRLKVPAATITNIHFLCTTAGATLTANQCIAGIYNSAGTLLKSTGDLATLWASTGLITAPLVSTQAVSQGDLIVAFYYNGTTAPTFARLNALSAVANANTNTAVSQSRFATADAARTTTLAATLGTQTAVASSFWVAVS